MINMIERSKEQVELMVPIEAVAGKAEQLRPVLLAMLAPSRAEKGCLFYNLLESHVPGHFIFHELWTTQTALDAHNLTPHYLQFKEQSKALFANPPIAHKVHQIDK
jgi:quinol monooxygenase YgiN